MIRKLPYESRIDKLKDSIVPDDFGIVPDDFGGNADRGTR